MDILRRAISVLCLETRLNCFIEVIGRKVGLELGRLEMGQKLEMMLWLNPGFLTLRVLPANLSR